MIRVVMFRCLCVSCCCMLVSHTTRAGLWFLQQLVQLVRAAAAAAAAAAAGGGWQRQGQGQGQRLAEQGRQSQGDFAETSILCCVFVVVMLLAGVCCC
jgi:hypothetical protein